MYVCIIYILYITIVFVQWCMLSNMFILSFNFLAFRKWKKEYFNVLSTRIY